MARWVFRNLFAIAIVALGVSCSEIVCAENDPDTILQRATDEMKIGPEAVKNTLQELAGLEPKFSSIQRYKYRKIQILYFAYLGMHKEQTEASLQALRDAIEPGQKVFFLYHMTDGYANMGQYDKALSAMNDSIVLLPHVDDVVAKMEVLQGAVSLLDSLRAYDDASDFAKRLMDLPPNEANTPMCLGQSDLIEIAFLKNEIEQVHSLLPSVLDACRKGNHQYISLSARALDSIANLEDGHETGVPKQSIALFESLNAANGNSDYAILLANAIAKRFVALGEPAKAESIGTRALQWANSGNAIQLRQQINETMASVMRAEGKLDQALIYADQSNRLWAKLLDDRASKEIAYQRMKFRSQDQSIQLQLLERINKLLTSERELQDRNKHILELLVFVSAILLAFVTVSLMRMWRQKNDFKAFSQIDGLTRISNRSHFIACAHDAFKDARGTISVIVFDLDEFKLINDTYGHAAGDWVLKTISTSISACLRAQDMFGRLGGEEFAICLPRASEQEAMVLAERCRMAIEGIDSTPSGHKFPISASFGIAVRPPNGVAGFEEVLAGADKALYQAKHMGRNRIVPYGEVASHAPLVA